MVNFRTLKSISTDETRLAWRLVTEQKAEGSGVTGALINLDFDGGAACFAACVMRFSVASGAACQALWSQRHLQASRKCCEASEFRISTQLPGSVRPTAPMMAGVASGPMGEALNAHPAAGTSSDASNLPCRLARNRLRGDK